MTDVGASAARTGVADDPSPASTAALDTIRIDVCAACGSRDLSEFPLRYEFRGQSFPMALCIVCGIRFLRVQPTPESLATLYSADYFESDFRCGRSATSSFDQQAFREENERLLETFERLRPKGRLLEVGPAAGWLLVHARERGWDVRGVELSAAAVEHARRQGLDVFHGTLEAAALPKGSADLVFLGDVLEHVPDCHATLGEVARVLAPGGHVVLRGPITTHSLARRLGLAVYELLGREIVLREPPYHLWEFTPGSLRRLFRTAGLQVLDLRQSKIPPGSVHGQKSAAQRTVMNLIDTINVPLTRALNLFGDRIAITARKA